MHRRSAEYYEAKAELMLRITELTASPEVRLNFFDLAMGWVSLAQEARQPVQQQAPVGISEARAPETPRHQPVKLGAGEAPAIAG